MKSKLLVLSDFECEVYDFIKADGFVRPLLLSYLRSVLFSMAFHRLGRDSAVDVLNDIQFVHGVWNEEESKDVFVEVSKLWRKQQESVLDTQLSLFQQERVGHN